MKIAILALAAVFACKWLTGRWPWELVGGKRQAGRNFDRARALLGLGPEAGHTEIIEAHKRLLAMVHPDRGGSSDQVHEANAARDLLLSRLAERQAGR